MRVWMVLGLVGCNSAKSDPVDVGTVNDTSSTADSTPLHTGDTSEPWVATDRFDDASLADSVDCRGTMVTIQAHFVGTAVFGRLDTANTAYWDSAYGTWNETHTLASLGGAPGTNLGVSLATGAKAGKGSDGTSSVFTCSDHFSAPGVMTHIFRAYGSAGQLLDCVAWGQDPSGFITNRNPAAQSYGMNVRPDEAEFSSCRVATVAR